MFDLVIGVGNPGSQYAQTKHNIAWLFFDELQELRSSVWKSKFKGEFAETLVEGHKTYFLKPQTFMNLSGESVQPLMNFFKIETKKILVVHDELDIPFGQVHFKMGGGLAGHNGLKSIAQHLGTDEFARMRIGIGRPVHGSVSDWVLSPFQGEMKDHLPNLMEKLQLPFKIAMKQGLNAAGIYNKKDLI